jgi:hypothetical protein
MMNLHEQFEDFLAELGVEMEHPEDKQYNGDSIPEITIHQASRDHYGVFYRLDIVNQRPELRIMLPVDKGDLKTDIYLVQLSDRSPLNAFFESISAYEGSPEYEQERDGTLQHLLYAVAEMMKRLFWSGDLQTLRFPVEIEVYPLVLYEQRRNNRRRMR